MRIDTANDKVIAEAAAALRHGDLVAFPTETVYGLGADATNGRAVARIFDAKGRPSFNPLIVHAPEIDDHRRYVVFEERAERLAQVFWPGALTIVLPRRENADVADLVSAGLPTIAVRVPAHPVARDLLRATERPVAAPSANRSGAISPTTAAHVAASLGDAVDRIVDGGPCDGGLESTVIDLTGKTPMLLRPGLVTFDALRDALGEVAVAGSGAAVTAPGMLASHYAPDLPIRLNVHAAIPGRREALMAFGPDVPAHFDMIRNLSPTGDLTAAAAELFAALHALDRQDVDGIAVMPIPETGLGIAINDRLRRAAAPRSGATT